MTNKDRLYSGKMTLVLALGVILASTARAQTDSLVGSGEDTLFGPAPAVGNLVTIEAQFTAPHGDQPPQLFITAEIKTGWHINSITQAEGGPIRTDIKLKASDQYRLAGKFQAYPEPKKEKIPEAFGDLVLETHSGTVTWHAPLELAAGADPAKLKIEGQVTVQPCNADTCLRPEDISFTAVLGQGVKIPEEQLKSPVHTSTPAEPEKKSPPLTAAPAATESTLAPAAIPPSSGAFPSQAGGGELAWRPFTLSGFKRLVGPAFNPEILARNVKNRLQNSNLWWQLLLAFAGGLVLNLMPCVLPVIGLKVLTFFQQSGQNRLHAFLLNLWYAAGLIAVFLILAALAASPQKLGWGGLFQFPAFNVAMAAIVFAMGLSFLGVWEIPIPGFIGSGKTAELAGREGFTGAFVKGVITTVLATPCTGPFMASALAWSVTQPPRTIYLVFFSVGLGMASPYLLIGAFPRLVGFLPKPGRWMDTFKQVMGLVLLGTVVYIFSFLEVPYCLPTLGLLLGCGIGCWWIGRTPLTAGLLAQLRAWTVALAFMVLVWIMMFPGISGFDFKKGLKLNGLYGVMASRYQETVGKSTARRFEELRQQGYELVKTGRLPPVENGPAEPQTVLVDFTADWCVNCKTLEAFVLNTEAVRRKIAENGVVPLKADWTTGKEPDVNAMLDLLGGRQVPTLAIFPAGDPNNPIIFRGGYTPGDVLEALEKAGPSKH